MLLATKPLRIEVANVHTISGSNLNCHHHPSVLTPLLDGKGIGDR